MTLAPVEVIAEPEAPSVEPTRPGTRLRGQQLRERAGRTLGELVGDEQGVSNSSFGPGVGLPVIRGLSGPRVRVLTNGSATHDASNFSPDHASAVEPMLADEVRILRGPSTIRYGGGAIGGVVDVVDARLPSSLPDRPFGGSVQSRYGFNGNERAEALRLRSRAGNAAINAEMFNRSRGDLSIPGCSVDEPAIRSQFGLTSTRTSCGVLRNSDARASGGNLGASWFTGFGYAGVAHQESENNYGIPPSAGSHGGPDNPVRIDMVNRRSDARIEWSADLPWLQSVRLDVGRTRYRHAELETGVVSTTFRNAATDSRLEARTTFGERSSGLIGMQRLDRRFSALGAEAFVPETDTSTDAFYLVQRISLGAVGLEAGWRSERQSVSAGPQRTADNRLLRFPARSFAPESYSLAATWPFAPKSDLRLIATRGSRAPEVHELYSFGPHLATRTFDQGNSNLQTESMRGIDLTLASEIGAFRVESTVFRNDASNFIFQRTVRGIFWDTEERRFRARCVRLEDCLPVSRYEQADARLHGYEIELAWRFARTPAGPVEVALFADRVIGKLPTRGEDIPRLPPRRSGMQVKGERGPFSARVRFTRVSPQDSPGATETPTAGHHLLAASLGWTTRLSGQPLTVFLNGRNLLDAEVRNATSFLRSFSPEPGRSLELGIQASF